MKNLIYPLAILFFLSACGGDEENASSNEHSDETTETANEEGNAEENEPVEVDITLSEIEEVPEACQVLGHVVDAYSWKDLNGTNYFIRTISEIAYSENDWGPVGTQHLWAYHYAEKPNGTMELLKETTDFVKECEFDLMMGHLGEAVALSDLDKDEVGEIAFIYRLACTSDVSPSDQKLIMLEDGNKYPLRGTTEVMGYGGDYEAGKEFDSAPEGFLEHADKLWNKHRTEYDDMN